VDDLAVISLLEKQLVFFVDAGNIKFKYGYLLYKKLIHLSTTIVEESWLYKRRIGRNFAVLTKLKRRLCSNKRHYTIS
jgi:hypothetical protein